LQVASDLMTSPDRRPGVRSVQLKSGPAALYDGVGLSVSVPWVGMTWGFGTGYGAVVGFSSINCWDVHSPSMGGK
jgi:hypothetical protein